MNTDDSVSKRSYRPTTERRERLVALIRQRDGEGSVHDLARELGVSPSTVRRDLAALQADQRIARTYGGVIDRGELDRPWRVKSAENRSAKQAIAAHAARLVPEAATVLLDAGTTVAELARLLGDRPDVHLVTNGLSSIVALADTEAEVTVLGGRLRRPSESIVGGATLQALQRITADVAFLGAEVIDALRGVNCPEEDQAAAKDLMARNAHEVWILADAAKLNRHPAFSHWCPLPPGSGLITDDAADREAVAVFRDAGWTVEVVGA
ncbi:DeoR/GlpR family DNA-binding transcription regulator [uncultured Aeromicrobium sp.]|uniref:DeoR/GlpR family DNA-binding transcription regulator n=1 Tax=uncultured Aeromicrobium sp. TaxID=337820 RepID=UPI0025CFDAC2|nr:DeoR/GlpR family DNA-binding transcription regulator [uncultured Aeromicrobium sp.]